MTVQSDKRSVAYQGTTQASLPYDFKIFEDSDLRVYKNGVLLAPGSDYSVTGAGDDAGGQVVLATPPQAQDRIFIERVLPYLQGIKYPSADAFPSKTHEAGLDRAAMRDQQLYDELQRAVRLPSYSPAAGSVDLTLPEPMPGYALGWDLTGTRLGNIASPGDLVVSSLGRSLVESPDAGAARGVLEVYSRVEVQAYAYSKAEADAAIAAAHPGRLSGWVDYGTANALVIRSGIYGHNGSDYELPSDLTNFSPGALAASTIYYVYLSPPGSGKSLDSTNFRVSTTPPSEDRFKGGLYDAATGDRCVGWFKTDPSAGILAFRLSADGMRWSYADAQYALNTGSSPTSLTSLALGLPAFGRLSVVLRASVTAAGGVTPDLLIANGHASGAAGNPPYRFTEVYSSTETGTMTAAGMGEVLTDAAGQILYATTGGGSAKILVDSFTLPWGLRRTD